MNIDALLSDAEPFLPAFDDALKLRGKARKPAIEKWLDDNTDHKFAALYRLLNEKSSSRKKLGQEYMSQFIPGEREETAYLQMMRQFIGGSKPSLHVAAFQMLDGKPQIAAKLFKNICDNLRYARDEANALRGLGVLEQVLDSEHAIEPEKAAEALDPVLDHWSQQISEKAAELIVLQGGEPRPSRWQGCPLSPELRRQLGRVGAKIYGTPDPQADRSIPQWENYRELDTSAVQQVPWPIAYIDRHVNFGALVSFDPDEGGEYNTGSGMYHAVEDGGRTFLLLDILYHDLFQYYITLDLTDTSDDPMVYGYDHEGWMRGPEGRLSRFLSRLTSL